MTEPATTQTIKRLHDICRAQEDYASQTLSLMASESYARKEVRKFSSSVFSNVTTEGFPGARFHPGSIFADQIETICIEEAQKAFCCSYANVQPHSASTANAAVLIELADPGSTIMGMELSSGGHLTHGSSASFSGKIFDSKPYQLTDGLLDYDQIRDQALKFRPTVLICGASSYPRSICFETFRLIAEEVGAILLADISHISGLVLAGLHQSPLGKAHVTTTSTYKQLLGPRGGLILSDHSTLPNTSISLKQRLDHAVFPLTQGTPDLANIASKAAALSMTQTDQFHDLMSKVIDLASNMAVRLADVGFKLVTNGTDTHMVLLDLRDHSMTGEDAEKLLEKIGILANRNMIPGDHRTPTKTSGLRIGTNNLAIRNFATGTLEEIVTILFELLISRSYPSERKIAELRGRVQELCRNHPIIDIP